MGSPGEGQDEAEADAVCKRWRKWVAVRDAPCPGHSWRYSACQIEYHYTHSAQVPLPEHLRMHRVPEHTNQAPVKRRVGVM